MQLALRDRLSLPVGVAPGVDLTHRAAQNARGSFVPSGKGYINLLTGSGGTSSAPAGFISTVVDSLIGQTLNYPKNWGPYGFTNPHSSGTETAATVACIARLDAFGTIQIYGSSNTNGFGYSVKADGSGLTVSSGLVSSSGALGLVANGAYFLAVSFVNSGGVALAKNLSTGQVTTSTFSLINIQADDSSGIRVGNVNQDGSWFGAVMASATYMSVQELLAWADDPWAYWYPNNFDIGRQLKGASAANTNASISGAGCSALAGSLAPQDSFTIGGAQAAAQAGSVSGGIAISGAQVAAQAGSVQPAISVPLAGAGASAQAGSISEAVSVALSGASASAQAGTVSFSGSINAPITGAQVSASAGSVAETDTIALSGAAVAAQAGQVSFSNALNVPLSGAQANTGAGSLAPAITTKALIGAAALAQAGAVFSSINLAPLGASAIGQAGILAETARFSLLGAAVAALAGHVTVSIGAAVLLASARLVRVAGEARLVRPPGESRLVRLGADARTITPGAS